MSRQYIIGGTFGAGFIHDNEDRSYASSTGYVTGVVSLGVETTLDAGRSSNNNTLSNGNLTVTKTGGDTVYSSTLSQPSRNSNFLYAEVQLVAQTFSGDPAVGVANASAALDNVFLGIDTNSVGLYTSGNIWYNNTAASTIPTVVDVGDWVGVRVDLTTKSVSFRNITKNGAWSNPVVVAGLGSAAYLGASFYHLNDALIFNFDTLFQDETSGPTYTRWSGASVRSPALGTLTALEGVVDYTADSMVETADSTVLLVNSVRLITDSAAFNGTVFGVVTGALAVTEAIDVFASTGTVTATLRTSTLAVTEAADVFAATGTVLSVVTGALATTEAADVFAGNGAVVAADRFGALAVVEGSDTALINGAVTGVVGSLAATESIDTAALTGTAAWSAALAVTEGTDTAAFTALGSIVGVLGAVEAGDTAAFAGQAAWTAVLDATEGADTAAFAAEAIPIVIGRLEAIEHKDVAFFTATAAMLGTLAATEGRDDATFMGYRDTSGEHVSVLYGDSHRTLWLASKGRELWLKNEIIPVTWLNKSNLERIRKRALMDRAA